MDGLGQSTGKLSGLLHGRAAWLGPVVLVVILVSVVAGIGSIVYLQRPDASRVSLLGERRVSESQLAAMVAAFVNADLADFDVRDGRILVPVHGMSRYLAALGDAKALPPEFHAFTGDAVGQNRFFESEQDRRRRIGHAEEIDLATAINRMPGIEEAMVKYDEAESRGFNQQRVVTASVNVVTSPNYVLGRQHVEAIRNLVATARAGLKPIDVCVTDLRSACSYAGNSDLFPALPLAQDYLTVKRLLEDEWHEKVRSLLSRFVANANVVVSVDLPDDWHSDSQLTAEIRKPEPARLAISVQIPASLYRRLAQSPIRSADGQVVDGNTTARDAFDQRIHAAIRSLLAEDTKINTSIHIDHFNDEIRSVQTAQSGWQAIWRKHKFAWMIVLAIGSTVALLPLARKAWLRPMSAEAAGFPLAGPRPEPEFADHEATDEHQLRGALAEMIRDDPDSAAEVFHQWLDRAG